MAVVLCHHPLSPSRAELICTFLLSIRHHSLTGWPGLRASPHLLWVIFCHRSAYTDALRVALLLQELRAKGRLRPTPEKANLEGTDFQQLCALVQEVHAHW